MDKPALGFVDDGRATNLVTNERVTHRRTRED